MQSGYKTCNVAYLTDLIGEFCLHLPHGFYYELLGVVHRNLKLVLARAN
jgi:hypothetical protein